jgi:cytidylate kinase
VLIQAPIKSRIERVMAKQNKTASEARELIELVDDMRENYINRYTGTSRYDTRNYDLVITMDHLSEDDAAALIMAYVRHTCE